MQGLSYVQDTSEILARILKSHGVNMYNNPTNTMRSGEKIMRHNLLHHLQRYICRKIEVEVRFEEHTKLDKPTGVGEHCPNTGHSMSITSTKVLERELDIKSGGHPYMPTMLDMNRDQGLPRIYEKIIPSIHSSLFSAGVDKPILTISCELHS